MEVLRSSPGIIRIVAFGGRPHPLPDKEIEALDQIVRGKREYSVFRNLSAGKKFRSFVAPLQASLESLPSSKNATGWLFR
jgi:transcription antitermination factor NusG